MKGLHLSPGPQGLGLPSDVQGSQDDPASSHIRCGLGLSGCRLLPILGLRFRFLTSAGCPPSLHGTYPPWLCLAQAPASWAVAHTQQAPRLWAKSQGPAHPPHFCPLLLSPPPCSGLRILSWPDFRGPLDAPECFYKYRWASPQGT